MGLIPDQKTTHYSPGAVAPSGPLVEWQAAVSRSCLLFSISLSFETAARREEAGEPLKVRFTQKDCKILHPKDMIK